MCAAPINRPEKNKTSTPLFYKRDFCCILTNFEAQAIKDLMEQEEQVIQDDQQGQSRINKQANNAPRLPLDKRWEKQKRYEEFIE